MDLYIATRSDSPGILKIGKSSNSRSRCDQLQWGHCFQISVDAILHNRGNCEKIVHKILKEYRIGKSEWFRVGFDKALEVARSCEAPQARRVQLHDLEATSQNHLNSGRTLTSTRYPHLKPKNEEM